MKTEYTFRRTWGTVELDAGGFSDRWWLAHVWVEPEYRNQGIAHKMLKRVCADADRECVHLALSVMPADDGITYEGLYKLYEEFGFVRKPADGVSMYRTPQPKEDALFIRDGYLTGVLRPRVGMCPICQQPKQRVIDVASFEVPECMTVAATIMFNRTIELPHTAIGLTCGCYAKLHRQLAHVVDSQMGRGVAV